MNTTSKDAAVSPLRTALYRAVTNVGHSLDMDTARFFRNVGSPQSALADLLDSIEKEVTALAAVEASHATGGGWQYIACHQCDSCQHIGINDEHPTHAACNRSSCGWTGPSPKEDLCPGCGEKGTMCTACPHCEGRYVLLADRHLPASPGATEPAEESAVAECGNTPYDEGPFTLAAPAEAVEGAAPNTRAAELLAQYLKSHDFGSSCKCIEWYTCLSCRSKHEQEPLRKALALLATPPTSRTEAADVPLGAIHNGRVHADRLEMVGLECEGGRLTMCADWVEFRRCFEHLADFALSPVGRTEDTRAADRSPQDFAIEHAEYMAKDGERLIEAVNDLARAEQECEDGSANPSDADAARETVNEHVRALTSGIYEFRKRRNRAALSQVDGPKGGV